MEQAIAKRSRTASAMSLVVLAAIVACGAAAYRTAHAATAAHVPRAPLSAADLRFLQQAAADGHAEVIAGKVAVTNAADPAVRSYGERIMTGHMQADHKLDELAMDLGVPLRSRPDAQQRAELRRLEHVTGTKFDSAFVTRMGVQSHERALALFRKEADAADAAPAVRRFARDTLPMLQQHLRTARELQARAGESQAARAATEHRS